MDVHRKVDAGFIHPAQDREDFGRFFRRGFGPFAVKIGANRIGSQIATPRTIGVAVGHNMDAALGSERARHRIGRVGQAFERTLDPPFGLGFARMLAGIEPNLQITLAHFEAVDRLPVQCGAEPDIVNAFTSSRLGDEIVVPLHREGREIGEPADGRSGQVADRQRAAVLVLVVARGGARPVIAIFRDAGVVIRPAAGIGAGIETGKLEHDLLARAGGNAEVKPLEELGFAIAPDRKMRGAPVDSQHFDIAAVEPGVDGKRGHLFACSFLTLIVTVSPLPPGKSLNKPAASVRALVSTLE